MAENKSLLKLAKGDGKKAPAKKSGVAKAKKPEVKLTPEEERDLKAKAKVKELLEGVSLEPPKKDDEEPLLEINSEEQKGTDWLQEQVAALSSENQLLKVDLAAAKDDYLKIFAENKRLKEGAGIQDESAFKTAITTVFHEIQSNYLKNPGNTQYGTPNFVIVPAAFLNRLIMYFPFLQQEKRF
jgi:hypothetical protein